MRDRLVDLGYNKLPKEQFYIVFEKGILESNHTKDSNVWHRDFFEKSIATCFSNIENWSTQVVNENKILDEKKDFLNNFWSKKVHDLTSGGVAYNATSDADFNGTLETLRESAKHGFLYNAVNVFHRAPLNSDLNGREVTNNDHRFFIRYQVRNMG